jgi:phage terminase small subunit
MWGTFTQRCEKESKSSWHENEIYIQTGKKRQVLTAKQKQFCIEYLKDFNGTQAAIRAGYSEDTAFSIASENLRKPYIKKYIQELGEELLQDDLQDILENRKFWKEMRDSDESSEMARLKASELLGKHKAMFTDKVEHSGGINIKVEIEDV